MGQALVNQLTRGDALQLGPSSHHTFQSLGSRVTEWSRGLHGPVWNRYSEREINSVVCKTLSFGLVYYRSIT